MQYICRMRNITFTPFFPFLLKLLEMAVFCSVFPTETWVGRAPLPVTLLLLPFGKDMVAFAFL